MRITKADLESLVRRLNTAKKYKPTRSIGRYKNGKFKSDKGFHLDGAYGGYKLVFSNKDSSAERNVTNGYSSKKELFEKMRAMLEFSSFKR
jgi:hypothetical protein|tara:strand:- start:71 stop:343 length:273 start_codon:yes stop_codon:yes gene_type:complete